MNSRAIAPSQSTVEGGGPIGNFFADEDRAQRNTIALRDVDYIVEADFRLTERVGPGDNVQKFIEMFNRRVEKGQHFHQPYLGCREFVADILPAEGAAAPIAETRDFGLMLRDIAFSANGNRPVFFAAQMEDGILTIPEIPEEEAVA